MILMDWHGVSLQDELSKDSNLRALITDNTLELVKKSNMGMNDSSFFNDVTVIDVV